MLNNNKPLCRIKAVYVRKSFLRRPLLAKAAAFCVADPEIFRYAWAIVATMYRTACAILLINNLRSLFLQCGCDIDLLCQQCPHVITNEVHASPPFLKFLRIPSNTTRSSRRYRSWRTAGCHRHRQTRGTSMTTVYHCISANSRIIMIPDFKTQILKSRTEAT